MDVLFRRWQGRDMEGLSECCPVCGNVIQPWANGVCYVCVRIEKEYKRYGRRRPQQRSAKAPEKKRATNKRGARSAPVSSTRKSQSGKRVSQREASRTSTLPTLPLSYEKEYGLEFTDDRILRKGINRFLMAVYGRRCHLSQILRQSEFDSNQIERLRKDHLDPFLRRLVAAWRWWFNKQLSPEAVTLLVRHYSLDGKSSETLARLHEDNELAEISADRLWFKSLSVLRAPKNVMALEHLVAQVAHHTLDSSDAP